MKNFISLTLLALFLSGCSLFHIHKNDIVQGNVITPEEVSHLHRGMSTEQVKTALGAPLLINVFTPNQLSYVYTFQEGHGKMQAQKLTCYFQNGRLRDFVRS